MGDELLAGLPHADPPEKDFLQSLGNQRLDTEDRRILEYVILKQISACSTFFRILFVGCASYTATYSAIFHDREYWTLDIDPERQRYGSSRHVVDGAENVTAHFGIGFFDVIICNGVFGFGLNKRDQVARAFHGFHSCLRPNGLFVLGWNDCLENKPFRPEEIADLIFDRHAFPPLNEWRWVTKTSNGHTFDFYLSR